MSLPFYVMLTINGVLLAGMLVLLYLLLDSIPPQDDDLGTRTISGVLWLLLTSWVLAVPCLIWYVYHVETGGWEPPVAERRVISWKDAAISYAVVSAYWALALMLGADIRSCIQRGMRLSDGRDMPVHRVRIWHRRGHRFSSHRARRAGHTSGG